MPPKKWVGTTGHRRLHCASPGGGENCFQRGARGAGAAAGRALAEEGGGTTGRGRLNCASSDDGKTCFQRGSRGSGAATACSLTIESYWSTESSSVFEFITTSRLKNSAHLRTPGIFESWGCQLSAATPFSLETQ